MKRIVLPLLVIAALYITGCTEKFDVAAPYKNITLVYGFLDIGDTAHYIRIQKAFLDQNKSAITMAQTPDSSFYKNLNVRIERYSFLSSTTWHDTIHLNRVDLDLEGYPKQPGIFFQAPNYAYKFTEPLDPSYIYRLVVTNQATGEKDSADAPVIVNTQPSLYIDVFDDTVLNKAGMDFASTLPSRAFEFSGYYVPVTNFNLNGATTPLAVDQAIIRFNWADSNSITHELTTHYYDYNVGYQQVNNNQFAYQIKNTDLYHAMSLALGGAPANVYRLLDRCDISLYLSTSEFNNYQQASLTQGTGLTGSDIEPVYTNIKGANALGLYTARAHRTAKITITPGTIDSMMNSQILIDSRIAGTTYHQ